MNMIESLKKNKIHGSGINEVHEKLFQARFQKDGTRSWITFQKKFKFILIIIMQGILIKSNANDVFFTSSMVSNLICLEISPTLPCLQLQFQYQMSYNHKRQVPVEAIRNKYRNFQFRNNSKSPPPGNLSTREIKRHSPINISTFKPPYEIKQFNEIPKRGSKTGKICKNVNKFQSKPFLSTYDYKSTQSQFQKLSLANTQQVRRKGLKQLSQNKGSLKYSASNIQISSKNQRDVWERKQKQKGQRPPSQSLRCIQDIEKVQRRIKSILLQK